MIKPSKTSTSSKTRVDSLWKDLSAYSQIINPHLFGLHWKFMIDPFHKLKCKLTRVKETIVFQSEIKHLCNPFWDGSVPYKPFSKGWNFAKHSNFIVEPSCEMLTFNQHFSNSSTPTMHQTVHLYFGLYCHNDIPIRNKNSSMYCTPPHSKVCQIHTLDDQNIICDDPTSIFDDSSSYLLVKQSYFASEISIFDARPSAIPFGGEIMIAHS